MKILISITLILASPLSLFANQKVLIRSSEARQNEYLSYLSLNPEFQSYSQYLVNNQVQQKTLDRIQNTFLQAQKSYYEKNYSQAIKLYKEIVGQRTEEHWNDYAQKIIITAMIKLYELTYEKKDKLYYLQLCKNTFINFHLGELELPSLIKKNLKSTESSFKTWKIPHRLYRYSHLIINGSIHEIFPGKTIKIPGNKFLVTLLSNQFYPIKTYLTYNQLKSWQPNPTWINSGNCQFPNISVPLKNYVFLRKTAFTLGLQKRKLLQK